MSDAGRFSWIQLKRMVGINPAAPDQAQEGQLRYVRNGDVDGVLYLAQYASGTVYEWVPVQILGLIVAEGGVTVESPVYRLNFDSSDFNISNPVNTQVGISLAYGTTAGTPAEGNHSHNETLFAKASSDSVVVVGTSFVDALTTTIGPFLSGVVYDMELNVTMRGSVDTTGFVRAYARIGSGSTTIGTRAGTVGGERTICATVSETRTGTGSTVALAARADMSTSTGTVTGMHIAARAVPRS